MTILGVLALVGAGCVVAERQSDSKPAPVTETKSVDIGQGVSMSVPSAWRTYGDVSKGEVVYIYDCPEGEEAYLCRDAVFVSSAETAPRALLEFSGRINDFSWYCSKSESGFCDTDEEKLGSVEEENGYWIAYTVGIADSVAVAFKRQEKFVIVFGRDDAQRLYSRYSPLIE